MTTPVSADTMAALALDVARRLLDADCVTAAVTQQMAPTLCDGLAGTALLHACLAHTDPAFEAAAHQHWQAAARLMGTAPPDGIHTGPGALAASLLVGSGYLTDPDRLRRDTLHRAAAWLSARAEGLAHHQQHRTESGKFGVPWTVYDAIKGLSGIGRVLLAAHTTDHSGAEPGLTAALTTLTVMIRTREGTRPGWWLPATDHPPTVGVHSSGAATTGLAHGICGPLALLSLAHHQGRTVPGQEEAIRTAASWILDWADSGQTWPPYVSGNDLCTGPGPGSGLTPGRRDAWCYGTPGITRALTLTTDALNDQELSETARTALNALARREPSRWDTEGRTLCHGTAGVLQAAARTGHDTLAHQAAARTVALHDPKRPFGFPRIENGIHRDEPGFLTGAAGTALALANYSGLLPGREPTSWDCLLLLS